MLVKDSLALYILSVDVGGRSMIGWNAQSYIFSEGESSEYTHKVTHSVL